MQAQLGHRSERSTHTHAHLGSGAQLRLLESLTPSAQPYDALWAPSKKKGASCLTNLDWTPLTELARKAIQTTYRSRSPFAVAQPRSSAESGAHVAQGREVCTPQDTEYEPLGHRGDPHGPGTTRSRRRRTRRVRWAGRVRQVVAA